MALVSISYKIINEIYQVACKKQFVQYLQTIIISMVHFTDKN